MINELLSTDYLVSYNVKVASMLGLHAAIFINELINIEMKAMRKGKVIYVGEKSFFRLDRVYMSERTTFTEAEQKKIEKSLKDVGVLETHPYEDALHVNIEKLSGYTASDDAELKEAVSKIMDGTKESKYTFTIPKIMKYLKNTDPEIIAAYRNWLYAIAHKCVSKEFLIAAEDKLSALCGSDKAKEIGILKIATAMAWKTLDPAITQYDKDAKLMPQNVSMYKKPGERSGELF